jgi:hypothetical protein
MNVNDKLNPFVSQISIITSFIEQSLSNFLKPIEITDINIRRTLESSSLANSNIVLMSNRLIDLQSFIELKFTDVMNNLIPEEIVNSLMNLPNEVLNNQANFFSSFLTTIEKLLIPLSGLVDLKNDDQIIIQEIKELSTIFKNSLGKTDSILSCIMNTSFFNDIMDKIEVFIMTDPLDQVSKLDQLMSNGMLVLTKLSNKKNKNLFDVIEYNS